MIVAFIGPKGHGKNTCASILDEKMFNGEAQFLAFADPIKEVCKTIFGWDDSYFEGKKKESIDPSFGVSPRKAMQYIGTEVGQFGFSEAFPEFKKVTGRKLWSSWVSNNWDKSKDLIITDMRFLHEHETMMDLERRFKVPYFAIRVERPDIRQTDKHISETSYINIPVDCIIQNSKKSELPYQIELIMKEVLTVYENPVKLKGIS